MKAPHPIVNDINWHAWRLTLTIQAAAQLRQDALARAAEILHNARHPAPK